MVEHLVALHTPPLIAMPCTVHHLRGVLQAGSDSAIDRAVAGRRCDSGMGVGNAVPV